MTNHVGRLYSIAAALLVFFVLWVSIASRPWATHAADARLTALTSREQKLRRDSLIVKKVVERRWAVYRVQLARRNAAIAAVHLRQRRLTAAAHAAAPPVPYSSSAVRVVNLPPLTITKTS